VDAVTGIPDVPAAVATLNAEAEEAVSAMECVPYTNAAEDWATAQFAPVQPVTFDSNEPLTMRFVRVTTLIEQASYSRHCSRS
jgi:hypothetical protein